MKTVYMVLFMCLIGSMAFQGGFAQETGRVKPNCNGHGILVASHSEWPIATRRSGCTRGIGFMCPGHGWILCSDNTILTWKNGALLKGLNTERIGDASLEFNLKENTVTYTMLKALPNEKEDDPNVFIVDEDVTIEMIDPVYLEKQLLQGLVIKKGEYKISYENSKYGEVTFEADIKL